MISPSLVYSISPGSVDWARPISGPSHKAAPWCGQRLSRPKYSPLMLKIAIGRSSMVTNLRDPGGSSPTGAMTCFAMLFLTHDLDRKTGSHFFGSCDPINLLGITEIER